MFNLFNSLDRALKKAAKKRQQRVLIAWNRGLGDIALGLYALVHRIRHFMPDAEVTFITRSNLKDGFALLPGVSVLEATQWRRKVPFDLPQTLADLGVDKHSFDLILEAPNPTRDLKWQLGTLTPKLEWNPAWDGLHERFSLPTGCIGVHVQTETGYAPGRDWPLEKHRELFTQVKTPIVLFGFAPHPALEMPHVIDLRGKTALFDMLSVIKHRCHTLLVPDSGVLSFTYYLNCAFPLRVVSLWGNPRMGVLKQNVASPNPLLVHTPLYGKNETAADIAVDAVLEALELSHV